MFKLNRMAKISLNTFIRYILRISYCSHILYFNTVDVLISLWFYHIMYKNRVKLNRSRVTQYILVYCDNLNLFTYATTSQNYRLYLTLNNKTLVRLHLVESLHRLVE